MPRLNIDDIWFDDPRREMLKTKVGFCADSVAIQFWRLAQTYHRCGMLIPKEVYYRGNFAKEFMDCGLAVDTENGVYVSGSKASFEWLDARSQAGASGGKKRNDAPGKQTQAKPSKRKQVQASSSSSSSRKEKHTSSGDDLGGESFEGFDLELIYQEYPSRDGDAGKAMGMARLKKIIKTKQDFELALAAAKGYKIFCDQNNKTGTQYVKMFSSFFSKNHQWEIYTKHVELSKPEYVESLNLYGKG